MKQFHIQWHILDRCNLRCTHCYQDEYTDNKELKITQLKEIVDNLNFSMKRWGKFLNLLITGGEPLLYNDLAELIEYIEKKSHIKEVSIITNAILLSDKIDQLKKYKKFKTILFSLEGVSKNTNDKIRGIGNFDKVLEQIKLIDSNRFNKILMYTVGKQNYKDAFELINFGLKNNLNGIIIEKLIPLGQSKNDFSNILTKNMLKNLYEHLLKELDYDVSHSYEYRALKIVYKENKILNLLNKLFTILKISSFLQDRIRQIEIKAADCIIGNDGCAIMPDGTVYPCRRLPLSIGNALNQSFYEIFENSEILKDLHDKSKLEGKCRDCSNEKCYGCRAMVYAIKNDLFLEDPHCWKSEYTENKDKNIKV